MKPSRRIAVVAGLLLVLATAGSLTANSLALR